MTKDYSGKNLSRRMNTGLLIVNLILLVCAVWLMIANLRYEEYTIAVAMGLVGLVAIANGVSAVLRLKGKKI